MLDRITLIMAIVNIFCFGYLGYRLKRLSDEEKQLNQHTNKVASNSPYRLHIVDLNRGITKMYPDRTPDDIICSLRYYDGLGIKYKYQKSDNSDDAYIIAWLM